MWAKKIGGSLSANVDKVELDQNDNIFIFGNFGSTTVDFDPSAAIANFTNPYGAVSKIAFFAKYDWNGLYKWAKLLGEGAADMQERIGIKGLAIDNFGNVILAGHFKGQADFDPSPGTNNLTSLNSSYDIYIAKYNSSGQFLWANKAGGTQSDMANYVEVNSAGEIYVAGIYNGTADLNPSITVSNVTTGTFAAMFIAKYSSTGSYIWGKSIGGAGNGESMHEMVLNSAGDVYITGLFNNIIDFNPSTTTNNLNGSLSGSDPINLLSNIFVAKYGSADGSYKFAMNLQSSTPVSSRVQLVTVSYGFIVGGSFKGTVRFDPANPTRNLSSTTKSVFFAKYNGGVFIQEPEIDDQRSFLIETNEEMSVLNNGNEPIIKTYPNPFQNKTNISYELPENSNVILEVYNVQGQLINVLINKEQEVGVYNVEYAVNEDAPAGIYLYKLLVITKENTFIKQGKMQLIK